MKPIFLTVFSLVLALTTPSAVAEDCIDTACINVYTENGQLIIEGRKGTGPVSRQVIKAEPSTTKAPAKKKAKPKPKVTAKPTTAPPIPWPTKKVIVKKRPVKKRIAKPLVSPTPSAQSLADRLIKALPAPGLAYQPGYEPLVNIPVYFSSGLPLFFRTSVEIVGDYVDVELKPSFFYDFGDGTTMTTDSPGGFYPDGKVTHAYKKAGTYVVSCTASWGGTFKHLGVDRPIPGQIAITTAAPITVVPTSNRFLA